MITGAGIFKRSQKAVSCAFPRFGLFHLVTENRANLLGYAVLGTGARLSIIREALGALKNTVGISWCQNLSKVILTHSPPYVAN